MEQALDAPEPEGGSEASEEEQGRSRHRRDEDGGSAAVPVEELGRDPRAAARGDVPALAGETAADTEERRRDAGAWHSDGARPIHPAGAPTGPAARIRPELLGAQLRLPTEAQRARRGTSGEALRAGRPPCRGGRGPGEVLRPGQPRRADGQAREADSGPSGAGADPSLSRSRRDGGRGSDGAAGRDTAGWPALAAARQRAPRRSGQGAGEARARVRPIRRRLQRLRAQSTRRATRDGAATAALRATPTPRQRVEERGRPGEAPEDPGLLVLGSPGSEGASSGWRTNPWRH